MQPTWGLDKFLQNGLVTTSVYVSGSISNWVSKKQRCHKKGGVLLHHSSNFVNWQVLHMLAIL